jgi:hypothetical protein
MSNSIKRINDKDKGYEKTDYILLDSGGGILSIDMFNDVNGEKINLAILLDKSKTLELIEYLQSVVDEIA